MIRFLLFAFLSLWALFVKSQTCIRGIVSDDSSRIGLSSVEIYLPQLNKSTETDAQGSFTICNIPHGSFILQVKHLGYKTSISTISVQDSSLPVSIRLISSVAEFPEVVVYGNNNGRSEETPNNIASLNSETMRENGALNLSDGIAKIPGVSQLTTGTGISKPVIRGLFGNRIQTVLLGLRFDNQQWQDEHGLGLSDVGVDRVEIIKGAASLLYGSEAMGGVLNVIEEKPAPVGKTQSDVSLQLFSNTYGFASDAGVKSANEKFSWRVRAGAVSHGDYSDGNNFRELNSRFAGYFAKASIGFNRKKWVSKNDYMFSLSNFGFLMDSSKAQLTQDDRLSRSFDMPHHTVYLNLLSSQNTFYLSKSKIKWNAGFQINNRQEQEGGNKISLNMVLNTLSTDAVWIKTLDSPNSELSLGTAAVYQTNKNIGSRTIIPDADFWETSAYSYLKHVRSCFATELGIRYDLRNIATFATGTINTDPSTPGAGILPFNRLYNALNGSAGISLFDDKHWNFKTNISSGYRAGNLAELSSNGLHEGTIRYEIGNINMKVEQNICADALLGFENSWLSLSASVYANRFVNYIYLSPTNTQYIGFEIFRYIQKNALLKGTEIAAEFHPEFIKKIILHSSYAGIVGKTDNGQFLPYIPARKITTEIKYLFFASRKNDSPYLKAGADFVLAQNDAYQFETTTPGYWLLNAGAEWQKIVGKKEITCGLSANNILNEVYYDHLSRFKYFGIYNIGRNIGLNFKLKFN
jgi:iron complex outermembrane recepter protein